MTLGEMRGKDVSSLLLFKTEVSVAGWPTWCFY